MSKVDLSQFDIDEIFEMELDGELDSTKFEKIHHKRRFDDGTRKITTGRKKSKVIRGGKEDKEEIDE